MEIQKFSNEFSSALNKLQASFDNKYDSVISQIGQVEEKIIHKFEQIVNESIMNIKGSIISALKKENAKLQGEVVIQEERVSNLESFIKGTKTNMVKGKTFTFRGSLLLYQTLVLKIKWLFFFNWFPEILKKKMILRTDIRFVNGNVYCDALSRKKNLCRINKSKLGFAENLASYDQYLA